MLGGPPVIPFARPHTDPTGGLRPEPSIGLEIHIFGVHFPSRRERVRERKHPKEPSSAHWRHAPHAHRSGSCTLLRAARARASTIVKCVCVRRRGAAGGGSPSRWLVLPPARLPRDDAGAPPAPPPVLHPRPAPLHTARPPASRAPRPVLPRSAPASQRSSIRSPSPLLLPPPRLGGLAPAPAPPALLRRLRPLGNGPHAAETRGREPLIGAAAIFAPPLRARDLLLLRGFLRPGFETDSRAPDAARSALRNPRWVLDPGPETRPARRGAARRPLPIPRPYEFRQRHTRRPSTIESRGVRSRGAAARFHPDSVSGSARAGVRSGLARLIVWLVGIGW